MSSPGKTPPPRRARIPLPALALACAALLTIPPPTLAAPAVPREAAPSGPGPAAAFVPGEIIVRYEPGTSASERRAARRAAGGSFERSLGAPRAELVEVPGGVQAALRRLRQQPAVAYAQPNYRYRALAEGPDTFFADLWGLTAPPQHGVNALAAWDTALGAGETIAVLDTGVDLTHPDLEPNLWHNPSPDPGVQDLHGYDFIDGNGDPDDYHFHGTHVAGTAAAVANNALGIAGVAPEAKIMAVRVLDGDGFGDSAGIADGIEYAAEEGAGVINLSLGGPAGAEDLRVEESIQQAAAENAVVVAAAGNDGADNDVEPTTPCALPNENLICVTAINQSGGLSGFSNYGATSVDVGAPGSGILSAIPSYGDPIFTEGFDNAALSGWSKFAEGDSVEWGASSAIKSAGSHSAADSPGGNYAPNSNTWLYRSSPLDLADERGCRMRFDLRRDIKFPDWLFAGAITSDEDVYDFRPFTGSSNFRFTEVSISDLGGRPDVFPAFALFSDASDQRDGAYVDELDLVCRGTSYVDAIGANGYAFFSGTSMATPHVAGVVALVRSAAPDATWQEIVESVLVGVRPLESLKGKTVTGGTADAALALEAVLDEGEEPAPEPAPAPAPIVQPTETSEPVPFVAPPQVGIVVPRARFVRRPGRVVRTGKRAVWLRFGIRARPAGTQLLCKIDRRPYRRCWRRLVRRFRLGRHAVRVKARLAGGKAGPARVHRFRVVRVRR